MRFYIAMLTAALLVAGTPFAHAAEATASTKPVPQAGPLKPGRSAGVRAAQLPRTGLALIGGSAIIAIIVMAAGTGSSGSANNPQSNIQTVPPTTAP